MAGSALQIAPGPLDPAQATAVSEAIDGLSAEQLTWVSGYLAGLAATRGALPGAEDAAAAPAPAAAASAPAEVLTVLYGSQTGNGRALAEALARDGEARGLTVNCMGMQDYRPAALKQESRLVIVVSTHGEGEPPDEAEALHGFLASRRAPRLEHLEYAVLALGDSSYEHFCQTGRDFDERLAALGARAMHPRLECDVDYEAPAAAWAEAVLAEVERRVGEAQVESAPVRQMPVLRAVESAPRYSKQHPFPAEVLANQRITARGSDWPVHHIELLLEGSGLDYTPGDALGVQPSNPSRLVDEIIETIGVDGDAVVEVGAGDAAERMPLHEALASRLEITVLTRQFLERLAAEGGVTPLQGKLAEDARDDLRAWIAGRQIVDVLREYAVEMAPQTLVSMLRKLTPRLYSIASSPLATPDEVHLTVARVGWEAFGREHFGAASTFLADGVGEGDTAPVYVQPNDRFRLPAAGETPIVMIGPGTGVAPFRAFVEHRAALGSSGRSWLFFGARHFDTDFLYQLEWLRHLKQGTLSRLEVAFSRDRAEKEYVQHRMLACARELYAWLEEGAHIYVCGDATRMAGDVHDALLQVVAREGGVSADRAAAYVDGMKRAGRYQRDVY